MNSIALMHNSTNDSIQTFLMHDDLSLLDNMNQLNYKESETVTSTDIFEEVFGKRERMRVFGVADTGAGCFRTENTILKRGILTQSLEIFFFTHMNMSFIKSGGCRHKTVYYHPISKPIYNELIWKIETISV